MLLERVGVRVLQRYELSCARCFIWDTLKFPGEWSGKTLAFFVDFWEKPQVVFCVASDSERIWDLFGS
jgi:hypothetical protein